MIWLGWTSNCWASSASVFSPLTAARATFALKAGEWFRRGRLLIVSPALRPSWPNPGVRAAPAIQDIERLTCALELAHGLSIGQIAQQCDLRRDLRLHGSEGHLAPAR